MNDNRIWELLGKRSSGELTPREQLELFDFLKKNAYYESFSLLLSDIMETSSIMHNSEVTDEDTEIFVKNVNRNIHASKSVVTGHFIREYKKGFAIAASLLLFIGLGIYFINKTEIKNIPNVVTTTKGSKSAITLPDGTKVWINADSKLTYDKSFGDITRDVYLTGEAFFDVVKDKNRQFIVHTKTMDIKVVGTAFNVKAYGNENLTEATLLRGAIEVNLKDDDKKINLKPNEKIIVRNDHYETHQTAVGAIVPDVTIVQIEDNPTDSMVTETKWMRNELVFNHVQMENLIPMLERWYNVTIIVKKEFSKNKKFNGDFEGHSIENVLESLRLMQPFNYKIEKDSVIIY